MDETSLTVEKPPAIPPVSGPENEKGTAYRVPSVEMKDSPGAQDEPLKKAIIPLSGKLITAEDPLVVGKNFRTLTNMRYGDQSPQSIGGMTKINTTAIDTYLKARNAHHFRKIQPAEATVIENHVLVQAYNAGFTASRVLQNVTAPSAQGDFSATALWSDSAGAGVGRFSEAPNGMVAYCNGVDTCLWGGNGIPCTAFITSTADVTNAATNARNYSDQMLNTRTDIENLAFLGGDYDAFWLLVRSPLPIKGGKFYISSGNVTGSTTMAIDEWDGDSWSALSVTDNTAAAGATLAQTGTFSFASTAATSKQRYMEGGVGFWYLFSFTDTISLVQIYHMTLDIPFQAIQDVCDGIDREIAAFYKYTGGKYTDYTLNVREDYYDSADAASYADLSELPAYSAGDNSILVGFLEKQAAINISVPSDKANAVAGVVTVATWSGVGSEEIIATVDGTTEGGAPLAKSGTISFELPDPWNVFPRILSDNSMPLYYYEIRNTGALTAGTAIYHVSGIAAPRKIRGYKFPIYSQDCLMLCNNQDGKRNSILVSAANTSQVFNGDNSFEAEFGDQEEINAGCTVFSQYGSNLFNITMLFKDKEIWNLVFNGTSWVKYRVSASIGCASGLTLDTVIIPPIEGQQQANRCLAVWATYDGVYVSEGRHPILVSHDIRDLFDQNATAHINQSYLKSFSGYIDKARLEYHLFIAVTTGAVTTLDDEWVLDMRRWRWFHVNRGTGKKIQCAVNVVDAYGVNHSYGFLDTGYMERLEYGNTFDGTDIVSTWQLGDFPLIENEFMVESEVKAIVPVLKAKTTTTADATFTLYTDTNSTGVDYTVDPTLADHRLTFPVKTANSVPGVLHSIGATITVNNETVGFEPYLVALYYQQIREHDYY